jgi:LysM repeat protein
MQVKDETVTAQLYLAERNVPPPPVLDGQARKQLYRVRQGDTLGTIARREGVSLAALRELNGIRPDSDHIRIGQKLKLPEARSAARRATASAKTKPETHLVRNGENPFVIARRYKVPLSSLLAENGLVQDAIIQPGQRLRIPSATKP